MATTLEKPQPPANEYKPDLEFTKDTAKVTELWVVYCEYFVVDCQVSQDCMASPRHISPGYRVGGQCNYTDNGESAELSHVQSHV